jgi:hypothetical protein
MGKSYSVVFGLSTEKYSVVFGFCAAYDGGMAAKHAPETREVVTCRLRPELIQRLDALADGDRRSRSEMIEIAVERLLEAMEPKGEGRRKSK